MARSESKTWRVCTIVLIILLSAIVAGYESLNRLLHPGTVSVSPGSDDCIGDWLPWQ